MDRKPLAAGTNVAGAFHWVETWIPLGPLVIPAS